MANIPAEERALKPHFRSVSRGACAGLLHVGRQRRDPDHAAARSEGLAAGLRRRLGSAVEALKALGVVRRDRFRKRLDGVPGTRGTRVALRAHHHAATCAAGEADVGSVQGALGRAPQGVQQVALPAHHQGLRFRVTEAAIEFEHLRATVGEHQAGEQHAAVVDAFAAQCVHGGHHHFAFDELHHLGGGQWRGAVGTHAAGVGPGVAFANLLVILTGVQHPDVAAIDQRQHAHFLSVQAFLDHHLRTRVAVLLVQQHGLHGGLGLLGIIAHHDALARAQAAGLHHNGIWATAHIVQCGLDLLRVERAAFGGGHIGAAKQLLAPGLVPLQARGGAGGAEHQSLRRLRKVVGEALFKQRLGADYDQLHVLLLEEALKMEAVAWLEALRARGAELTKARVGGGIDPQLAKARALPQFPCKRMFAAAASGQQHVALVGHAAAHA